MSQPSDAFEHQLIARAATLMRTQRFLSLATTDGRSSWAVTLPYAVSANADLIVCANVNARHARHLEVMPVAACTIFDATSSPDDLCVVQCCVQAQAIVKRDVLAEVVPQYEQAVYADVAARARLKKPLLAFLPPEPMRFYKLSLIDVFVPDVEQPQAVARRALSIASLKSALV